MNFAKYLFFVLLLLLTAGAGCTSDSDTQAPPQPGSATADVPAAAEIQATLVVDKKTYAATIEQGSTALELMNLISQRHDLTFSGKDYGELGLFIEQLNGVTNNAETQQYWTLYVNDAMAQVGVSSYVVQNGDTVEWRYEVLTMEDAADDASSEIDEDATSDGTTTEEPAE